MKLTVYLQLSLYAILSSLMEELEQSNFYQVFKDTALGLARKRGELTPAWDDVLMAIVNYPKTDHVLTEREIHTVGIDRDIQYSLLFGRPSSL